MKVNITKEQLASLLASADDSAGNHLIWVDINGDVHLDLIANESNTVEFVNSQKTMIAKVDTFAANNGYVGVDASNDTHWINCLLSCLAEIEAPNGNITNLKLA